MKQGETDLTKIRVPLVIFDADGNLVKGYVPGAHELQTSYSGSAWADAAGTLVEVATPPSFTIDATKGWAFPATAAEWTNFLARGTGLSNWGAPTSLYNCQEDGSVGHTSLVDSISGNTLAPNANPLYGTTVAGMARKAVSFTDNTISQKFFATTGVLAASTNSVLWLMSLDLTVVPAGTRVIMAVDNAGAPWLDVLLLTSGKIRIAHAGATADTTSSYVGIGPFWIAVLYDRTNARTVLMTSTGEILTVAWANITSDSQKGIGAVVAAGAAAADFFYVSVWYGATAERSNADITALFSALTAPPSNTAGGVYYYQGVVADAATEGFLAVYINKAGYRGMAWRPVVGTSGLTTFPYSISSGGSLVPSGSLPGDFSLSMSLDGATFTTPSGTHGEMGGGYYYYRHDVLKVDTPVIIEASGTGIDPTVVWGTAPESAGDSTAPTIAAISPTPGVAPGVAGGFPASYSDAKATPIVLDITDADPGLAFLVVTNETDGAATVYRGSNYLGDYVEASSSKSIANGVELSILPASGWPAAADRSAQNPIKLRVDAIDGAGNLASSSFVWTLPAAQTAVVVTPEPVAGVDHTQLAIDRLAFMFRGSP